MADHTKSDLLRRAATKLRELATPAWLRQDPWSCYAGNGPYEAHVACEGDPQWSGVADVSCGTEAGPYVAMMHPPVALALAAVMDRWVWMCQYDSHMIGRVGGPELIALAREVLREYPTQLRESSHGE